MQTTRENTAFRDIDAKQQKRWNDSALFAASRKPSGKKFYSLDMFPYPSGTGLHVGHPEGYTASDILARRAMMGGADALRPMGWDAFGLPAENYAIQTGVHPEKTTKTNTDNFRRQIQMLGMAYDWGRELSTTDPAYYKWTQWIFLQLFKKGLAYESMIPINWCPSCKTGLANEEVFGGNCDRCGTAVRRKNMRQWLLKITAYADRLLAGLDGLDWPESTLAMQRNWIGRSEGAEIDFQLVKFAEKLRVFTTRPDTIYGATYMVIAPEHPLARKICAPEQRVEVENYINAAAAKSEFERSDAGREKTGVFTGAYAANPVSKKEIPVWIADYVLGGYGTGAIMAVPAHDERDWQFAEKFGLPVIEVVKGGDGKGCFCGEGTAANSPLFDGLPTARAKEKIIAFLEQNNLGCAKTTYRLRDWVFSRQRYWGEPIPIVHCEKCGPVPVPESELPLTLPPADKFQPTGEGESPLANIADWVNTKCPQCGGPGRRETNTMPQWAGSCWYYLRFIDPKNDKELCAHELQKAWLPVDCYIGGSEHAVLHLLYARFWHKFLFDIGAVSTEEPFVKLRHQGLIRSYAYRDGRGVYHPYSDIDFSSEPAKLKATGEELARSDEKMSKSKKNVVVPDSVVDEYGADVFRMYEMFMGPLEASKPWDMKGIEGVSRFVKRVYFWADGLIQNNGLGGADSGRALEVLRHKTIKKVSADIDAMCFNTAISALMIYFNELHPLQTVNAVHLETLLKLLHPFAPHITEELWQKWGREGFLVKSPWPVYDEAMLKEEEVEIAVQVNGKVRERLTISKSWDEETVRARALEKARKHIDGKTVVKVIVVPGRIASIIVK
ncbi:MAG: leucine--tRNA ligase [Elusimicrobiales bacterium]